MEKRLHDPGPWFYRRLFWECGMIGQILYLEAEAAGLRATGIGCFYDDPTHHLLGIRDHSANRSTISPSAGRSTIAGFNIEKPTSIAA
jgi:hypothetical protein